MKHYNKNTIVSIQRMIDAKQVKERRFYSFDELPKVIYSNGMKVVLGVENGHHVATSFPDFTFDKEDGKEWRKEALGRFLARDWKSSDKHNNIDKYVELSLNLEGKDDTVVLCRRIDEGEVPPEDYQYLKDVRIQDEDYAIIKVHTKDEKYGASSSLEVKNFSVKMINNYVVYNPEVDDSDMDCCDINSPEPMYAEAIQSAPLF